MRGGWNKGIKWSEEYKELQSKSHIGQIPWNKGKPMSEEQKVKISNAHKGKIRLDKRGKNSNLWKGGIIPKNLLIRTSTKYKVWREAVFTRDNWTCVKCKKRGGNIEVDHYPKKFSEIVKENGIKSLDDAKKCDMLWNLDNGRTVCLKCHNRTKQVRSRFKKLG